MPKDNLSRLNEWHKKQSLVQVLKRYNHHQKKAIKNMLYMSFIAGFNHYEFSCPDCIDCKRAAREFVNNVDIDEIVK